MRLANGLADHLKSQQPARAPALPPLLQVRPDSSTAQRSKTTGHLVLTMPKEDPSDTAAFDVTCTRSPQQPATAAAGPAPRVVLRGLNGGGASTAGPAAQQVPLAVQAAGGCGNSGAKGGGGATVWEQDGESNLVERQLQCASLAEASQVAGDDVDDLPPL